MTLAEAAPNAFAERLVDVTLDDRQLFQVGFKRICLMGTRVYVTLKPLADLKTLTVGDVKILRQMLQDLGDWEFFCEIPMKNKRDIRFAKLFGFTPVDTAINRLIMEIR